MHEIVHKCHEEASNRQFVHAYTHVCQNHCAYVCVCGGVGGGGWTGDYSLCASKMLTYLQRCVHTVNIFTHSLMQHHYHQEFVSAYRVYATVYILYVKLLLFFGGYVTSFCYITQ